ncbi:MAG: amidohydrolase family protein [Proteobacteria bacterium]|nr:amidohydrolase family protein [Pseudomonadota bacterium]
MRSHLCRNLCVLSSLLMVAGLAGCASENHEDEGCNPATYNVTCSDGIQKYCGVKDGVTQELINVCASGCAADGKTCNGGSECNSATHINTCANNILTKCENNAFAIEYCQNGCAADGRSCAGGTQPQCNSATYVNTCANNILTKCENNAYAVEFCVDGCAADGKSCKGGSSKQCDSATYTNTCVNNVLTKCVGDKYVTENCSKGCAADGKSCDIGGETDLTCKMGPGTVAKGTTYNQFTYTGCACDANYVKTCGVVNGQEVAFTCYYNKSDQSYNEEYLPCEKCRIENGRYECGEGGGGTVTPIPGEGEVNIVDAKYPQLNITENSTKTSSLEQHGTEQISGPRDPAVETCGTLSISGSNTCSKTGSSKTKYVIQGDILTKDKTYLGGSVVIENGKITSVGCTADTSNATVITCPDAVVSAGLINAHDHITYSNGAPGSWGTERFDHRHDWRKGKEGHNKVPGPSTSDNEVPELRQIMGGTTSIFGSGKVQGLARNIDKENQVTGSSSYPTYDTFPLSDSGGTLASSGCSKYKLSGKYNAKYFYGPHIGEGINDAALNEFVCLSDASKLANEFSSKLAVIHGVSATPKFIKLFADTGAKLIWSPRTNVSLYGDTARVTVYDNMGVTIALGTDWIYSGSANMLREFQCVDFLNTYYYNKHFSDYDVWRMATYNGAFALGLDNYIGDLKAGLLADIAVFKKGTGNRILHRAVLEATNKDVTLVMIDGKMVYGDANIMDAGETVDVCGSSKKVDTKGAGGSSMSYSQIDKAKAYKLFFCEKPANEPTCVPIRTRPADTTSQGTTMYDGEYSDPNDIDGDGIPNDVDNCPNVFNPVRPEDKNAASKLGQGDWDGDGFGDVCDKFPIDKSQH